MWGSWAGGGTNTEKERGGSWEQDGGLGGLPHLFVPFVSHFHVFILRTTLCPHPILLSFLLLPCCFFFFFFFFLLLHVRRSCVRLLPTPLTTWRVHGGSAPSQRRRRIYRGHIPTTAVAVGGQSSSKWEITVLSLVIFGSAFSAA